MKKMSQHDRGKSLYGRLKKGWKRFNPLPIVLNHFHPWYVLPIRAAQRGTDRQISEGA